MNTKELKIGNYVKYPLIGIKKIDNGSEIDAIREIEVLPINIDDEILLKCRFANSGIDNTAKYFRHPETSIAIAFKGGSYSFIYCEKIGDFIVRSRVSVDIAYLHQLQNLYYCLTGQELDVNI